MGRDTDFSGDRAGGFGDSDRGASGEGRGGFGGGGGGGGGYGGRGDAYGWSGDMQDHLGAWGSAAGPMGYGRTPISALFENLSLGSLFGAPEYGYGPDYADVQGAYAHGTQQGHLSDLAAIDRAMSGRLGSAISTSLDLGTVNLDAMGSPQQNYGRSLGMSLGALGRLGMSGPGLGFGRSLGNLMDASRAYGTMREAGLAPSAEYSGPVSAAESRGQGRPQRISLRNLAQMYAPQGQMMSQNFRPVRMPYYGG